VITLCAVLGLIRNSVLSVRTEGNGWPGRNWPDTKAFLAA